MNSISILNNHSEIKSLLQDFSPNKKQLSKQPSTNTSQIESLNNLQKDESLDQVLAGDIGEWGYSSQFVPEDTSILFKDTNENVKKPDLQTYEKRKKYFGDSKKRQAVTFEKGKLFSMDFYDAYVDFNNFQIKLPGFSLSAFRYWDGQPLRFTAKTRCGKILFCVNFELLLKDETEIGKYRVEEEKESTSSPEQEIIDDGDSVKENSESIYESAEDEDSNDQMKDISNSFEKI